MHNSSLVLLFQDTWPQALRMSPLSAGTWLPWDSLTPHGCRGARCPAGYMLPTGTAAPHEKRSRRLEGTGTSAPTFRLRGSSPEWVRHGSAMSWLNMLINIKGKLLILRNKMAKLPLLFKFFTIFFSFFLHIFIRTFRLILLLVSRYRQCPANSRSDSWSLKDSWSFKLI